MLLVLSWRLVAACGESKLPDEGVPSALCEELGALDTVEGTPFAAADACAVSAAVGEVTIDAYIDGLPLLKDFDCWSRQRCVGVGDGDTYEIVERKYSYNVDAWTQDTALFGADGLLRFISRGSERGHHCLEGGACIDCCELYCCDGVPTAILGSGNPVALEDCEIVTSACANHS